MSEYGLRIRDTSGNTIKITPLVGSIITAGLVNSPTSLNDDNTYGFDIDLPGTSDIPLANLAVIAQPRDWGWTGYVFSIGFGSPAVYTKNFYALSTATYYTMGVDGIMTAWTAGNCTSGDTTTWDPLLSAWAVSTWMVEDDDLYTSIRIFPATANLIYDASESTAITAYNLYGVPSTSLGVGNSSIIIILKQWDY